MSTHWSRMSFLWSSCCYQPLQVETFATVFSVPQFTMVNCVGQTTATKSAWSLSRNTFCGYNNPLNAGWGINLNHSAFPIFLNNPFLCANTERARQLGETHQPCLSWSGYETGLGYFSVCSDIIDFLCRISSKEAHSSQEQLWLYTFITVIITAIHPDQKLWRRCYKMSDIQLKWAAISNTHTHS